MTNLDQAGNVRTGEDLDTKKIGEFLKEKLPELKGEIKLHQFHSGYSNLTYLISIGDTDLVLRRPPFGKKAKTAHDMGREFRILTELRPFFPYAPEALLYCDDPAVMDEPFYVMRRLNGIILRADLPKDFPLDEAGIGKLSQRWIGVLSELHNLDYKKTGLSDLGNPAGYVSRQVKGWSERYRNARTPDVPDYEAVMAWLAKEMPADHDKPALIHNDYKFDNVVLDPKDPTKITGVLDWEMTTIGDPLLDLGSSLGYWVENGDSEEMKMIHTLPTLAPGMWTRKEVVKHYSEMTGTNIDNFAWYYCFGLFRLAVIAQQIYYRFYHGQTQDKRFGLLGFAVGVLEKMADKVMRTGEY